MSQPVVVTIPHRLGKQEAARRLKAGFGNVRSTFGEKFMVIKEEGSRFSISYVDGCRGMM